MRFLQLPSTWRIVTVGCAVLQLTVLGCARSPDRPATRLPAAERFDDILRRVSTTPLEGDKDSTGQIVGGLVTGNRLVLLDLRRAEVRLYRRTTGKLIAVAGGPGDGFGDFRAPSNAAALDSGRFVVYDGRRNLLSFRDSAGNAIREARLPYGYYGGFAVFPSEKRLVLTGGVVAPVAGAEGTALHEFDFEGKHVRSFGKPTPPKSDWQRRFALEFVEPAGEGLVTGALNSSRLRLIDRTAKTEQWIEVAPGWQQLDWPSDKLLGRANREVVATRIRNWSRQQRLMNGVFALGSDRFLVRFETYATAGDEIFYYVLVDKSGQTLAISHGTRSNIVATKGDSVFWIGRAPSGGSYLGVSVARPAGKRLAVGMFP